MNGKIVLCLAVVFFGQAMSAATGSAPLIETPEEIKKVAEQLSQSAVSISNHLAAFFSSPADAQKSVDKVKTMITKGFESVDTETNKLKDIVLKNADPKLVEKYNEFEKIFRQQFADAKVIFEDKVGKPLSEKVDLKKVTETMVKTTKEFEGSLNKAIDGLKKP